MSQQSWFSTRVRLVVLIEGAHAMRYSDSVFVFRAADFDDAFRRALALGRKQEQEYVGGEGKRVRRRLKEVVSLDIISADDLDGAEVYSEPVDLATGEASDFDQVFTPESSKPTQTI